VDAVPRTSTGKIDRRELARRAQERSLTMEPT